MYGISCGGLASPPFCGVKVVWLSQDDLKIAPGDKKIALP